MPYQTDMSTLMQPLESIVDRCNWIASDLEVYAPADEQLPIHKTIDWISLTPEQMKKVAISKAPVIWGVFSAIPLGKQLGVDSSNCPTSDGNPQVFEPNHFQLPHAVAEIVAWDSTFTIFKTKDRKLSERFKAYFPEAEDLANFNKTQNK